MSNIQTTTKALFEREDVKKKFQELLGKRSTAFMTSVLQIVSQSEMLSKVDPTSVYQAAAVAATLDLPLNSNLGFAYIVPYKDKAQFQMGYKGFIQLAQRSGLYETISASPIYEGQLVEQDPLEGFKFDFKAKTSDKVIGYAAHFKLLNGFRKTLFMSVEDLKKHGKQFSQTYKKGYGLWEDNFEAMAIKTVLKLLLSKFAPLSIEMQKAVITDQALIKDADGIDVEYVDNTEEVKEVVSGDDIARARLRTIIAEKDDIGILEEYRPKAKLFGIEAELDERILKITADKIKTITDEN